MMNTRKSNNMLHDLQDYIRGVEAVAAARKDQLERIYEEQRDRERKERMAKDHCRSHENDFLNFGNQVNTPTKIRTLTEEVKAQKDKVRHAPLGIRMPFFRLRCAVQPEGPKMCRTRCCRNPKLALRLFTSKRV